jgi:tRNA (mo5U34)-methyltransferase
VDLSPYRAFFARLDKAGLGECSPALEGLLAARLDPQAHGDLPRWWDALAALPEIRAGTVALDAPCVGAGSDPPPDAGVSDALRSALMALHPWRKGPFRLHGVHIDSEWRSDWKWDRLAGHIAPLAGRTVLDVGCGNGYHCWRMAGSGARVVLGIDPTILYAMQFLAVARYLSLPNVAVLPLALEDLPGGMTGFDTVFSMGVLYHRRSPVDHLLALRRLLRPGGELVLETLVLDGEGDRVLVPAGRYARMRNVWFIPTPKALAVWLGRCGFRRVRVPDVSATSTEEQRSTDWMRFESLRECLDPQDPTRTVEGDPAPRRGILVAEAGRGRRCV